MSGSGAGSRSEAALKKKIKAVMRAHLQTKGWPNITYEEILKELKPMWLALEEKKLLLPGMTFEGFCAAAEHQYFLALMWESLNQ